MAAPKYEIVHKKIYNEGATQPLILPILVLCNTPDEQLAANVRANTEKPLQWLMQKPERPEPAIIRRFRLLHRTELLRAAASAVGSVHFGPLA